MLKPRPGRWQAFASSGAFPFVAVAFGGAGWALPPFLTSLGLPWAAGIGQWATAAACPGGALVVMFVHGAWRRLFKVSGPGLLSDTSGSAMGRDTAAVIAMADRLLEPGRMSAVVYDVGGKGQVAQGAVVRGHPAAVTNVNRSIPDGAAGYITPKAFGDVRYDGTGDLVIMSGLVEYLDDGQLDHVLSRAFRCLRPGGQIIVAEGDYSTFGRRVASWVATISLWEVIRYRTRADVLKRLDGAGFGEAATKWSRGRASQSFVVVATKPDGAAAFRPPMEPGTVSASG